MRISVCIITRNEVEKLEKCLMALQPYGMELVIVDTGSADGTKEMASKYTDAVYDFKWCDDFSAARNYALTMAQNDRIMVLDSDEYVKPGSAKAISYLEKSMEKYPKSVGRIQIVNYYMLSGEANETKEWLSRIFDRRLFHYEGRIHEQISVGGVFEYLKEMASGETYNSSNGEKSYETFRTDIAVEHDGYGGSGEDRLHKAERNICLLLQEFEAEPEDTYILYQLGKGYYMAGNYPESIRYFELALGYDLNPKLEYVMDMVETYGYALLNSGQPETALLLESVYDEFGNSADFQFLMGLIYMNNEQFERAVEEFLKAVKQKEARLSGTNSYLAYYNAGVIRECLGDRNQAMELYKKCGRYEKAVKRLEVLQN